MNDPVDEPRHYTPSSNNSVEAIQAIRVSMSAKEFQAYCKGNLLKYIWRYPRKGLIEDLRKAQVYLGWLIESMENEAGDREIDYSAMRTHYGIGAEDMADLVSDRCDDCE